MKKIICFCLLFLFFGIINVNAATTYKVNYVLGGGTNNKKNISTYTTLKSDFTLLSPSKVGYTFDGWYTDKALTNKVTTITKGSTGNKTYYAKWIVNTYSIKFSGNGAIVGLMLRRNNFRYDKNYILVANNYIRPGYKFTGWNTNAYGTGKKYGDKATVGQVSKVNGGVVTLYAQWKIINYGITYYLNGGVNNADNPSIYNVDTEVILKNPTKEGFTFGGWYTDSSFTNPITSIPKGNIGIKKVYAKWIVNIYTIKYNGNGATSGTMNDRNNLKYDKNYILDDNKYARTGYKFIGWNTRSDGKGKKYTNKEIIGKLSSENAGVVTLYAQWKVINYVINYDVNYNGVNHADNPSIYNIESIINLQDAERVGYSFEGWYLDPDHNNKITTISNSIGVKNLYANWTLNQYTITYVLNGGTNSDLNHPTYNVETGSLLINPRRVGYVFDGWYTDADFTNRIERIQIGEIGNITLYAKWVLKKPVNREDFALDLSQFREVGLIFNPEMDNYYYDGNTRYQIYVSDNKDSGYNLYFERVISNGIVGAVLSNITPGIHYYKIRMVKYDDVNEKDIYSYFSEPVETNVLSEEKPDRLQLEELANIYIDFNGFSKSRIRDIIADEKYSDEDIDYVLDNLDVDWNKEAVERANWLLDHNHSIGEIINLLKQYGFTDDEANYGYNNCKYIWD